MATASDETITYEKVVRYHYTITGPDGQVVESSEEQGGEPVAHLVGAGEILPEVEDAMIGRKPGDSFTVTVAGANAFGPIEPPEVADRSVSRDDLPGDLEVGGGIIAVEDGEQTELWIKSVREHDVVLTTNHPLAGKDLTVHVEILDLRGVYEDEQEAGAAFGWSGTERPVDG